MSDIDERVKIIKENLDLVCSTSNVFERFYKVNKSTPVKTKQVYSYSFDSDITLIPIGDVHLGHKNSNLLKLMNAVSYIHAAPNCYTILLGDLGETATKTSVGMAMFEEDKHIPEQLDELVGLLKPISNKILGVVDGNHEARMKAMTGISPMELLAERLNITYFGYQGYLNLKVGNEHYHVAVSHGGGGGASPGAAINAARKQGQVTIADIYLSGHTHAKHSSEDLIYYIDDATDELKPLVRHYVGCGSFLEYWDGYAEQQALAPKPTGAVVITLNSQYKDIRVMT